MNFYAYGILFTLGAGIRNISKTNQTNETWGEAFVFIFLILIWPVFWGFVFMGLFEDGAILNPHKTKGEVCPNTPNPT